MDNVEIDDIYDFAINAQLKRTISKKNERMNKITRKLEEKQKITALKKQEISEKTEELRRLKLDSEKIKTQLSILNNEKRIKQEDMEYLNQIINEYEKKQELESIKPWGMNVIRELTYDEHHYEIMNINRKLYRQYENIEKEIDLIDEKNFELKSINNKYQNEIEIRSEIISKLIELIKEKKLDEYTFCEIAIFLVPEDISNDNIN